MTTKDSPEHALRAQADKIAIVLKDAERGRYPNVIFKQKLMEARSKPEVEVGVVMDDKVIRLSIPWTTIRETSKEGLVEYIVGIMQERKPQ